MKQVPMRIADNHSMLDMIRIRKHLDTSVEALKEDLCISRAAADAMYKALTEKEAPIVTREGRRIKIIGSTAYFLGISIGSKYLRTVLIDLNFDPVSRTDIESHPKFKNVLKLGGRPPKTTNNLDSPSDNASYEFEIGVDQNRFLCVQKLVSSIVSAFTDYTGPGDDDFPILGVGFAVTGPVDYEAAVWRSAPKITDIRDITIPDLIGHLLLEKIEKKGLFLSLDNNAKAAMISEYQYLFEQHGGRFSGDVGLVYIGSGVGCAAVVDQKLLRGSHNLSGELGYVQIEGKTIENYLSKEENYQTYIPFVLNMINCLLGIDRFVLVGHDIRKNTTLIPALMDRRIQFTVASTQQYCKAEAGRGLACTSAIGAAIGAYLSMCQYDFRQNNGSNINLAKEISWTSVKY